MSVLNVLRASTILAKRNDVGHIHYFTKEIAFRTLIDTGYTIVDYFYTSASNKTNKSKNATKKALPEPYEGDDSDDDNAKKDLSFDINDEDEEADEDETITSQVMRVTNYYELSGGYLHFKWFKNFKLFDSDTD